MNRISRCLTKGMKSLIFRVTQSDNREGNGLFGDFEVIWVGKATRGIYPQVTVMTRFRGRTFQVIRLFKGMIHEGKDRPVRHSCAQKTETVTPLQPPTGRTIPSAVRPQEPAVPPDRLPEGHKVTEGGRECGGG